VLEGLLVDLVPFGKTYRDLEHKWRNAEASFWSSGGERFIMSRTAIEAQFQRWDESRANRPTNRWFWRADQSRSTDRLILDQLAAYHEPRGYARREDREPEYWGGGYGTDALMLAPGLCV